MFNLSQKCYKYNGRGDIPIFCLVIPKKFSKVCHFKCNLHGQVDGGKPMRLRIFDISYIN